MEDAELFSGLDNLFAELTQEWSRQKSPEVESLNRWRIFNSPVVAFLFIMQKVSSRNSLSSALEYLRASKPGSGIDKLLGGSRRLRMQQISSSTGGLSQARGHLSVKEAEELFANLNKGLLKIASKPKKDTKGIKWYLLDGSMIGLQNTERIKQEFPIVSNQHGECRPNARIIVAHNLEDGIAQYPALGSMRDSEQSLSKEVIGKLPMGSGIIADRNFGVFSMAWCAQSYGVKAVVRLTEMRAACLLGKKEISHDGSFEVSWKPSKKDLASNPEIPKDARVSGTLVAVTVQKYGYRDERMFFFTTDTSLTPELVVDRYKKRWLIENDIRTLKSTVHLDIIYSKTPDMIRKEIIFGVLAYNMIRALIAKAASKVKLLPRDISFTRAVEVICTTATSLKRATTPLEVDITIQAFYKSIYQIKLPTRHKLRFEPRAIVAARYSRFPTIKKSRQDVKQNMINKIKG